MSTYQYDRLDLSTDAIRLLRLCKGGSLDPIRCYLFQAVPHAESGITYEALSYTWGDASDRVRIYVNDDKTLHVTRNLYLALEHLRCDTEDRFLWVDAVCIDQGHHKERNHQVGQMKLIYENADKVVIWLGVGNHETDTLFDMVQQLDKRNSRSSQRASVEAWRMHWAALVEGGGGTQTRPYGVMRDALQGILARPWFERIWVIQEAYSARRATVVCGRRSVASRAFAVVPGFMNVDTGSHLQALLAAMPGPLRSQEGQAESRDLKTASFIW
ncbi:hypothetical protein ACHAQH_004293 [Verticillium albo-atrum]